MHDAMLDVDKTCLHVTIEQKPGQYSRHLYLIMLSTIPELLTETANCAGNHTHKMVYTIELLQNTDDWVLHRRMRAWEQGWTTFVRQNMF